MDIYPLSQDGEQFVKTFLKAGNIGRSEQRGDKTFEVLVCTNKSWAIVKGRVLKKNKKLVEISTKGLTQPPTPP